jgi:hypothetical protein
MRFIETVVYVSPLDSEGMTAHGPGQGTATPAMYRPEGCVAEMSTRHIR